MTNTKINLDILKNAKRRNYTVIDTIEIVNGQYLKDLRDRLNMSQSAFAHVLGVTKKAIEKWEQGKNPIKGSTSRLIFLINEDSAIIDRFIKVEIDKKHESEVKNIDSQYTLNRCIYYGVDKRTSHNANKVDSNLNPAA